MYSVCFTMVSNTVPEVRIYIPAFTFFHQQPFFAKYKFDALVCKYRHVNSCFSFFEAEIKVAMRFDDAATFEVEQPYRHYRAFHVCNKLFHGGKLTH